jgi:hypothetical protein
VGSPDFKQALLERLHGENQINKEKWAKLWYDPFDGRRMICAVGAKETRRK